MSILEMQLLMAAKRTKKAEKEAKKRKKAMAKLATGNQAGRIGGGYGAKNNGYLAGAQVDGEVREESEDDAPKAGAVKKKI